MSLAQSPSRPWRWLSASGRILAILGHVLKGLWTLYTQFSRWNAAAQRQAVQDWSVRMLRILGVQLNPHGANPLSGPVLLVANHLSWLDILVMNAVHPARFVSKADVLRWPLLGRLVAASGTLFIERERRRDALRVVHHMADRLAQGDALALFPEGTTGDGQTVLPFHANLFQSAVHAQVPVQPVALRYLQPGTQQPSQAPIYVGSTNLIQSVWRTLCAPGVVADVHFLPPEPAHGRDRRAWAQACRGQIAQALGVPLVSVPPQPDGD